MKVTYKTYTSKINNNYIYLILIWPSVKHSQQELALSAPKFQVLRNPLTKQCTVTLKPQFINNCLSDRSVGYEAALLATPGLGSLTAERVQE